MLTIIFASTGITVVLAAAVIIFIRFRSYRHKSSAELSRVRKIYDEECKKVESSELHIQELTQKIAEYEIRIAEGETASEELSALLEKTKDELRQEEDILKEKTAILKEIKGQLTEAETAFENEKEKVRAGSRKISKLNKELEECRQKLKDEQALVKEKITELEKTAASLAATEKKLESQDEKSEFIAAVVNAEPEANAAFEEYKTLLNKDYQMYANDNDSLAEEARAMKQLLDVQDQLELIAHDEELAEKQSSP